MATPDRLQLAAVLRSYVADLRVAGPQYAAMAAVLKEAADELDPPDIGPVAAACNLPVYDGDAVPGPGRPCPSCED